jgi:hypothetical protein
VGRVGRRRNGPVGFCGPLRKKKKEEEKERVGRGEGGKVGRGVGLIEFVLFFCFFPFLFKSILNQFQTF